MDASSAFTDSKWTLLEELSRNPLSPVQLSELKGTSVANISQQLRLLEAYGLVSKKRTSNYEPGKPRIIYSVPSPKAFVASVGTTIPFRAVLSLNEEELLILRIWNSFDSPMRQALTRLAFDFSPLLQSIHFFGFPIDKSSGSLHEKKPFFFILDRKSLPIVRKICLRASLRKSAERKSAKRTPPASPALHSELASQDVFSGLSFDFAASEEIFPAAKGNGETGGKEAESPMLVMRTPDIFYNPRRDADYIPLFVSEKLLRFLQNNNSWKAAGLNRGELGNDL